MHRGPVIKRKSLSRENLVATFQAFESHIKAYNVGKVFANGKRVLLFVEMSIKQRVDIVGKFIVVACIGVMGFTEPAKKRCVEFSHRGFVMINPNIFFMKHF